MTSFLNSSIIDFSNPRVSVKSTGVKLGLEFPLSVRKMLDYRDKSKAKSYGVCLCEYGGQPRGTKVNADWLNKAFSDPMGIAKYFRKMSGGRQFIEWQVFIPNKPIMPYSDKLKYAKDGLVAEIAATAAAAKDIGVPVASFNNWIWIPDDNNVSKGGTTDDEKTGDTFAAAKDLSPNIFCHEMGHSFGLHHHAGKNEVNDYGDSFCLMGGGLTFSIPSLTPVEWLGSSMPLGAAPRSPVSPEIIWGLPSIPLKEAGLIAHSKSGPGICAPYLYQLNWIDDENLNIYYFDSYGNPKGGKGGSLTGILYANQGAPPVGSPKPIRKIAIRIIFPLSSVLPVVDNNSEYWIEYRIPQGFDTNFQKSSPPSPPEGILILREFVQRDSGVYSLLLNWIPVIKWHEHDNPTNDGEIRLPRYNYLIRINDVDITSKMISYSLERN